MRGEEALTAAVSQIDGDLIESCTNNPRELDAGS